MRWLLLKDLQILRRSPLLVALLVLYPVVVAVLIGAALSRRARASRGWRSRTSSAPARASSALGGADARRRPLHGAAVRRRSTRSASTPARRRSRRSAPARRSAALVIPADATERLQATLSLGGGEPPDRRGLLQRRGPGQAPLRRVDDPRRGWPTPTRRSRRRARAVGRATSTSSSRRQALVPARSATSTSSGCATRATLIDASLAAPARGRPSARALEQVSRFASSRPTTSTSRSRSWPRSASRCGSSRRRQGLAHAARRVRGGGRRRRSR